MVRLRWIGLLGAVLAGLVLLFLGWDRSRIVPDAEPRPVPWSVDFERIDGISVALPSRGTSHRWIKGDDGAWYFESLGGMRVDDERWGIGIPLLVSGPEAQRLIAERASSGQLSVYGFDEPQMIVGLSVVDAAPIEVEVGGRTPDGGADYVRLAGSLTIYAIHHTWKDTLASLVTDPPIARQ